MPSQSTKTVNYSLLILLTLTCIYLVFSYILFTNRAESFTNAEPKSFVYRSDEMIFLKTFYLMQKGKNYYQAFLNAVQMDARGIHLTSDSSLWRMPTIFYIWLYLGRNSIGIGRLFMICSALSLVAVYTIMARLAPRLALLSPIILMPYFFDAYYYATSMLFSEWWGWFFFIFGLSFYLHKKHFGAIVFFVLATLTRELFILPMAIVCCLAVFFRKDRFFFLSVFGFFLIFYTLHILAVNHQDVPKYSGSIFSRLHAFDSLTFHRQIAFSMRQYPFLELSLPLAVVLLASTGIIYQIIRKLNKKQALWNFLVVFVSLIPVFIMPFISSIDHDYWGIAVMPTVIVMAPLSLLPVKDFLYSPQMNLRQYIPF